MNAPDRKAIPLNPGPELLDAIKAGFVAKGTTYIEWCRGHNVTYQNARVAMLGGWRGPKATRLVLRLIRAAGLTVDKEVA